MNERNEIENVCKFSGLSLKNELNQTVINHKTFDKFLSDFINKTQTSYELYQQVTTSNFKTLSSGQRWQKFSLNNKISRRRTIDINDEKFLTTYPYGYTLK